MSQGYITIAQNNTDTNYLEQAYGLALSLRASQSTVKDLAVCVDSQTLAAIEPRHERAFSHIITIPWGDEAASTEWKIQNKWKVFHMTPFEHTVLLDADMVFPTDVSHWWSYLTASEFWATTTVHNFRGEPIPSDQVYRKTFQINHLPNVYSAFMYFCKCDLAAEIFRLVDLIFHNRSEFFTEFLEPTHRPAWISGDVAFALAIKLLGVQHLTTRPALYPTFIHMKAQIQNVHGVMYEDWQQSLATQMLEANHIKIGNHRISLPLHYTQASWLTPQRLQILEAANGF